MFGIVNRSDSEVGLRCHNLAKWLSHYLYFFSFLFLSDLLHIRSVGKCYITSVIYYCHSHIITKGYLLIVVWLIVDSKYAYKRSLDSDKRCC